VKATCKDALSCAEGTVTSALAPLVHTRGRGRFGRELGGGRRVGSVATIAACTGSVRRTSTSTRNASRSALVPQVSKAMLVGWSQAGAVPLLHFAGALPWLDA
jgi:hypothetical protein